MNAAPSEEEVRQIVAIGHPVLRNLAITQAYSEISRAFAGRCPGANWCTFATWASRQAGQTIRGEDLHDTLDRRLHAPASITAPLESLWRRVLRAGFHDPSTIFGRLVREIHGPLDALEHASDAVGRGNKKVFEEIAEVWARFLAGRAGDQAHDPAQIAAFCEQLKPGEPPDGQRYLRQAFTNYYSAMFEPGPKTRAELMFLANLEVGLHEQTRLQPEIRDALDVPLRDAADLGFRVLAVVFPRSARWWEIFKKPSASLLGVLAHSFAGFCFRLNRHIITECLMTLRLPPGAVLRLGAKMNAPAAPSLAEITNPALLRMLAGLEPDGTGDDAADVEDWSVFRQRLHFIAHLFRSFHESSELFDPPFTPEQIREFREGRIPDGDL